MASFQIDLGSCSSLVSLFSYPNQAGSTEPLTDTILHWLNQTLARDGFAAKGATASLHLKRGHCILELDGPDAMKGYVDRLPAFLENGKQAEKVCKSLRTKKKSGKGSKEKPWPAWVDPPLANRLWDPQNTGTWRFFLPFGMGIVNSLTVNFFHYPPMRLLDEMRDYLDDPVPVRLIELMQANGIKTEEEAWLYSTVMDGAPIAAPDDQGTIYKSKSDFSDPVHLIPIAHFHEYQKAQTELLLNTSSNDKFTVPIVVFGTSARESFNAIWNAGLSPRSKPATLVKIRSGLLTPVLCSGHPYAFFAQVQEEVGAGEMMPEAWPTAVRTMTHDLAVIRWQILMARDASADPAAQWESCLSYWSDPARLDKVYQLVIHQGSLWYPDPKSLKFTFKLSMEDVADRARRAADATRRSLPKSSKAGKSVSTKKRKSKKKSGKK